MRDYAGFGYASLLFRLCFVGFGYVSFVFVVSVMFLFVFVVSVCYYTWLCIVNYINDTILYKGYYL